MKIWICNHTNAQGFRYGSEWKRNRDVNSEWCIPQDYYEPLILIGVLSDSVGIFYRAGGAKPIRLVNFNDAWYCTKSSFWRRLQLNLNWFRIKRYIAEHEAHKIDQTYTKTPTFANPDDWRLIRINIAYEDWYL